jgi:UDP-N-acetylmuramyl pentapeptide phosphotransferase/UDP-N-acetylglucosamine-1-phosphate transferase
MISSLIMVAFLVSAFLTLYFSYPETRLPFLDKPNKRSLHKSPIPATGGIAILSALSISTLLASQYYSPMPDFFWIWIGTFIIAGVSFVDDCKPISPSSRLIVHFFAAFLLLSQGKLGLTYELLPGLIWTWESILQVSFSFLFVVWMLNLYNFMDGMDGFAGGMTIFGFGTLALLGYLADHQFFMVMNLIITAATSGFLVLNFPPARIFMGDVGSSSLGFLAAAFSLWGSREGIFPLWIAILLFSPFIVDATITLIRRLLRKEKIWLPHKTHYYQRLVQLGWGHKRTVLWQYVLMAACSISALFAINLSSHAQWILLICWAIIYMLLMYFVNYLEQQKKYLEKL